jgi:hypothetical protein
VFTVTLYFWQVGKHSNHWSKPTPSTKFPGLNQGLWMGVHCFEDLLQHGVGLCQQPPLVRCRGPVMASLSAAGCLQRALQAGAPVLRLFGHQVEGERVQENQLDSAAKISVQKSKP